jgi:hypothetical protein
MDRDHACYGKLFPSLSQVSDSGLSSGKVFALQIDQPGMIVRQRAILVDRKAWEECVRCPDFDGCYRLSTGTLLLQAGLAARM